MVKPFSSPPLSDRQGGLIGIMDAGCGKIACVMARYFRDDNMQAAAEIVGVSHRASKGVAPAGFLQNDSADPIANIIEAAETMAGERLREILVLVNGRQIINHRVAVEIELNGQAVLDDDVNLCVKRGVESCLRKDQTMLHVWPTRFRLDRTNPVDDPRGLCGETLLVEITCLAAPKSFLANLRQSLERCDVRVRGFLAAPYAASCGVLMADEKQMGALCLDIGARTTSFAVWQDGALCHGGHVPIGGDHISGDLAKAYGLGASDAERIKVQRGLDTEIGEEGHLSLADVIAPRMEEIFERVLQQMAVAGIERDQLARAIITGGSGQLENLTPIAEAALGLKIRIGKPLNGWGGPSAVGSPAFASLMGAIELVHADFSGRFDAMAPIEDDSASHRTGTGPKKAFGWLRDHF